MRSPHLDRLQLIALALMGIACWPIECEGGGGWSEEECEERGDFLYFTLYDFSFENKCRITRGGKHVYTVDTLAKCIHSMARYWAWRLASLTAFRDLPNRSRKTLG